MKCCCTYSLSNSNSIQNFIPSFIVNMNTGNKKKSQNKKSYKPSGYIHKIWHGDFGAQCLANQRISDI